MNALCVCEVGKGLVLIASGGLLHLEQLVKGQINSIQNGRVRVNYFPTLPGTVKGGSAELVEFIC